MLIFSFEDDDITDKSIAFYAKKLFVKSLLFTNQEIAPMCKVIYLRKKNITEIDIDIICENNLIKV